MAVRGLWETPARGHQGHNTWTIHPPPVQSQPHWAGNACSCCFPVGQTFSSRRFWKRARCLLHARRHTTGM